MKKLILSILLLVSITAGAQVKLFGNATYNLQTNRFSWLNSTDTIARISTVGMSLYRALLMEAAGANQSITSTTTLGASSGGSLGLYAKDLPTAANQQLGILQFGSRNGSTADNVGARIRVLTNGAWTDGSAEQAYMTFETNATGTLNEVMRITANGRISNGNIANPNSRYQIAAGSTALAPFSLTSGSVVTTPVAGTLEWDASANGGAPTFTPVSTRYKTVLATTGAATDGQIPIGSTASGVYTSATLTAGTGVAITNAAGAITISSAATVTTAGTTDFTITIETLTVLPSLAGAANRTITFPSAASNTGRRIFIWNSNADANLWSFGSNYTDPNGTTASTIGNGTFSVYWSTGSVWLRVHNN